MGGGQRGGRGGMGGAGGGAPEPIARFQPTARQTVSDMLLSTDENYVFIAVTERPEVAARNQDVPDYVTESSYPEMINGRSNVGDSQARRLLAVLDLKQNRTLWADASAFAGDEKAVKPGDKPVPRIVDWSLPDCSEDGATLPGDGQVAGQSRPLAGEDRPGDRARPRRSTTCTTMRGSGKARWTPARAAGAADGSAAAASPGCPTTSAS